MNDSEHSKDGVFGKIDVPDHDVLCRIGQGSYGEVWLARNVMGAFRAIKVIHRSRFDTSKPFERELLGIRKFEPISRSHEGFIHVLHIGTNSEQGYFYYIMEVGDDVLTGQKINPDSYRSRTLESELKTRHRLEFEEILKLALSITKALSHLHAQGLVHRDIKPSNILFVNGVPKLADIGLVAPISDPKSLVGTIGYMPPEGPGLPQADVYSLGKVLYEISTGNDRQKFPALPEDFTELKEHQKLIELNEILIRACSPDFSRRYETAWDMHAELTVLANGKSVRRLRYLEGRWAFAKKLLVTAGAATIAILAVISNLIRERHFSEELVQRQKGANIASGSERMTRGDYSLAVPFFVASEGVGKSSPVERSNAAFRLSALAQQMPKLVRMWFRDSAVNSCRLTSDGSSLVVSSWSNRVEVLDVNSGKIQVSSFGPHRRVLMAVPHPLDTSIVTASERDGASCWKSSTNSILFGLPYDVIHCVDISSDGMGVVTGGQDGKVRIWEIANQMCKRELSGHKSAVRSVSFSRSSRLLSSGDSDGLVQVWSVGRGERVCATEPTGNWIFSVAFSPDESLLAAGCADRTCRVYDAVSGKEILPPIEHPGMVSCARFTPDGRWIVTACMDSSIRFWDAKTGHPAPINGVLQSSSAVMDLSFNSDGSLLAAGCSDGSIRIWDMVASASCGEISEIHTTGAEAVQIIRIPIEGPPPRDCRTDKISSDGLHFVHLELTPGQQGSELSVSELGRGLPVFAGTTTATSVSNIVVSPQAKFMVATFGTNITVTRRGREEEMRFEGLEKSPPNSLFVDQTGARIALVYGASVEIRSVTSGMLLGPKLKLPTLVKQVLFYEDGFVAVACQDTQIRPCSVHLWRIADGVMVGEMQHGDGVLHIALDQASKLLVSSSEDTTTRVWDLRTHQLACPVLKHPDEVLESSFNQTTSRILTICRDGKARIWAFPSGESLTPPLAFTRRPFHGIFLSDMKIQVWGSDVKTPWLGTWDFGGISIPEDRAAWAELVTGGANSKFISKKSLGIMWERFCENNLPSLSTKNERQNWHAFHLFEAERLHDAYAQAFHLAAVKAISEKR